MHRKDEEDFVVAARAYCLFAESNSDLPLDRRIVLARFLLADLYAAQLRLPSVDGLREEADRCNVAKPANWPSFGTHDVYYEVHNPCEGQQVVAGLLSEDLWDVYRSLKSGLIYWDSHREGAARWEWTVEFAVHWGDHLIDALRALHRLSQDVAVR